MTVKTADTLMCLGRGEVAELSGRHFDYTYTNFKFVIFPSTSGQHVSSEISLWIVLILFLPLQILKPENEKPRPMRVKRRRSG